MGRSAHLGLLLAKRVSPGYATLSAFFRFISYAREYETKNAAGGRARSELYGCGLRLSEALRLRAKDVELGQGILAIRDAKGGGEECLSRRVVFSYGRE